MSRKEWALLWIGSILFAAAFSWPLFEHMGVSTLNIRCRDLWR